MPNISRYKVTITDASGASAGAPRRVTATVWGTTYVPETLKRDCVGPWAWTVQGIDDDGGLTRLQRQGAGRPSRPSRRPPSAATPSPVTETASAAYRPPLLDWPGVTGADGYQVWLLGGGRELVHPCWGKDEPDAPGPSPGSAPPGRPSTSCCRRVTTTTTCGRSTARRRSPPRRSASSTSTRCRSRRLTAPADCPLGSCADGRVRHADVPLGARSTVRASTSCTSRPTRCSPTSPAPTAPSSPR